VYVVGHWSEVRGQRSEARARDGVAMNRFTQDGKDRILEILTKSKKEDCEKFVVYRDVYAILHDTCECRLPLDNLMPSKGHLMNYVEVKMKDIEASCKIHSRLIQVMESIAPVQMDEKGASRFSQMFRDHEKGDEYLRGRHHSYGAELVRESQDAVSAARKHSKDRCNSATIDDDHVEDESTSAAKKKQDTIYLI
jgi:hypothetical protein